MTIVDEISPDYMGDNLIGLSLSPDTQNPQAFSAVVIDVDYEAADPEGLVVPLELIIRSPTQENTIIRSFRDTLPTTISFVPQEGGAHLVLLREVAHNRFTGTLELTIGGDRLTERNI